MNVLRLIWLEILHRKASFALALTALVVAVAVAVSTVTLVRGHQLRAEAHVAQLDDQIRKIMKDMGFNVDIMPKGLNKTDFFAQNFGEATMPYDLVEKLADSHDVVSINHLRPSLIRKVHWKEKDRDVILMGIAAVVPWHHRKNPKIPLEPAVPQGKIVVGAVLAEDLDLKLGGTVEFRGESFEVEKIHPRRESSDDHTVWIDLQKAQQMFDLEGRINMIQALECNCSTIDRMGEIRAEIANVLGGDVQVYEHATKALARAEARNTVKEQGIASLNRFESQATMLTVLLAVAACALVGLLTYLNARVRRQEIGILRAIGTSTRQVIFLFVGKALLLGALAAVLGSAAGFAMGVRSAAAVDMPADDTSNTVIEVDLSASDLFIPELFTFVFVAAIVLTVLASWIPAVMAAAQDPATILTEE